MAQKKLQGSKAAVTGFKDSRSAKKLDLLRNLKTLAPWWSTSCTGTLLCLKLWRRDVQKDCVQPFSLPITLLSDTLALSIGTLPVPAKKSVTTLAPSRCISCTGTTDRFSWRCRGATTPPPLIFLLHSVNLQYFLTSW